MMLSTRPSRNTGTTETRPSTRTTRDAIQPRGCHGSLLRRRRQPRWITVGLVLWALASLMPAAAGARPGELADDSIASTLELCVDQVIRRPSADEPGLVLLIDEEGEIVERSASSLPAGLREGDCLVAGRVSAARTEARRAEVRALIRELAASDGELQGNSDPEMGSVEEL